MEKSARPRTALNECVKVVVRCRPLSEKEKNEGYDEVRHGCFVDIGRQGCADVMRRLRTMIRIFKLVLMIIWRVFILIFIYLEFPATRHFSEKLG